MKEKRILTALCLAAVVAGCRSVPTQRPHPDISVTLHPITYSPLISSTTNSWLITDVSQRDPIPDGAFVGPRGVCFPDGMTPELKEWREKYAAQVDLIVEITNTSTQEQRVFEEWNSWGYCNLKFVFENGFHEYWVTKQPGLWYRNFSSFRTLAPGKSLQIPVALADHIWSGLDQVRTNASEITSVRALYEQYQEPAPSWDRLGDVWNGSVSSPFYSAADLLPRFGFRKIEHPEDREITVEPGNGSPMDFSDPDDIQIQIEM